ncbi:AAA family ATPase [Luteimonas dalianensis]|uniref:AAA family ATPase n=1 Tax=Luteimonas dalianensis TaxID=1148196 RepID=UPI003BF34B5D
MALHIPPHDAPPIIAAAREWVQTSLVNDGSVFGTGSISTAENYDALDRYFVQRPDAGEGSFYEKLRTQLADAPPEARKLMAELLWALFLFPSNIGEETKRAGILEVWDWSGESLDPSHPMLSSKLMDGIGSGGMGVNSNRWREMIYLVRLGQSIKAVSQEERAGIFADYDRFVSWVETLPDSGDRQFRHMLRYFLFPERVERMSSNGDRRKVLAGFGEATLKETRHWTDRQLDDALLELRGKLEDRYGTRELDFYLEPLRDQWRKPNDPDEPAGEEDENDGPGMEVREPISGYRGAGSEPPRNLILYGPPGTGKTWKLQQLFRRYTDQPADVDRATWELGLVARYGWRAVIAAALADLGQAVRVTTLEQHPLVKAKATQRKRSNVRASLWGYMQTHAPPEVTTVNVADRRPPYLFVKTEESDWAVLPDWRDVDLEAADLLDTWRAGPGVAGRPVPRYRVVTFHPSYSYEDFVIGLRPVVGDSGAAAGFRMVDGVFKQICAEARSNPGKRYALFIDEINRANIAKVFGELITLIEPGKRARYDAAGNLVAGMEVQLPGTGDEDGEAELFGVPENLDIYGTMNTADRSIALLDIALRRRFAFEEMPPDYKILQRQIDGVDLARLLEEINRRLEFLADRDRLIGHAYFIHVSDLEELRTVFQLQVIPLLQEYFFDDWSRVALVLSARGGRSPFLRADVLDAVEVFGDRRDLDMGEHTRYTLTPVSTWSADTFRSIYESPEAIT